MEQFRTKLKLQNLMIAVASFVVAIFCFLAAYSEFSGNNILMPVNNATHFSSLWRGCLAGTTAGFLMVMIALLVRNIIALCDENRLRKLYVRENDEREIQIWTSARAVSTQIFLIGGMAASIIAGYFHTIVSITILACTFVHAMIALIAAIYYKIKL